ncbi:MAG: hypothetical protein AAFO94_14245, partial [Bacteroidota bacterium]
FIAKGGAGTNSTVSIEDLLPAVRIEVTELGNTAKDYVINNGTVNVTSGTAAQIIKVIASDETVENDQSVCVKVTVEDFENIFGLNYTMRWDPAVLNFTEVRSFGLPGLGTGQFNNSAAGVLRMIWQDPAQNGVTVDDGTLIYEICFDAVGAIASSSDVSFSNDPVEIEAVGENLSNPTVNTTDGSVQIIGDGGFVITIGDANGNTGDTVCVPLSVSGFNDILGFNWSINWDPNVVKFVRTQNFGLGGLSAARITNTAPGVARVLWFDNSAQGITLADGTVLHDICFEIIGDVGTSSPVQITGTPTPVEVTQKGDTPGNNPTIPVADIDGEITVGQATAILRIDAPATQITNVNCFGDNTGAIDLAVTGGVTPYTYAWSNSATTEDINGLAAGNYTVTVTDANGDTASETFAVSQPASALSFSLGTVNDESAANANDGSIDINVSGGTTPYTFAWSNGATTEDLSGLAAGTYTVTITDANGCSLSPAAITVDGNNNPALTIDNSASTVTNVTCFGEATGAINLVLSSGGVAPLTYAWSNNATTEDISGLAAGNYSVTVTDAASQTASFTFSVSQPNAGLSLGNPVVTDNAS